MAYAEISNIREGSVVRVEDVSPCLEPGNHIVMKDQGGLYIYCYEGLHYLDGHLENDGTLHGMTKVEL